MLKHTVLDNSSLTVSLNANPPEAMTDKKLLKTIDELWEAEKDIRGENIFNGALFSVDSINKTHITGHLIEYKWFLAQLLQPELFKKIKLQLLAVSGLLQCQGGIVFGQRSTTTTQDSGEWELVPSGGIDNDFIVNNNVLYRQQLLQECQQELAVAENTVELMQPFILVEDTVNHVVDIGMYIKTNLSAAQVKKAFQNNNNHEYQRIEIIPADAAEAFVADYDVIEVSRALLNAFTQDTAQVK